MIYPKCRKQRSAPDQHIGKKVRCSQCSTVFQAAAAVLFFVGLLSFFFQPPAKPPVSASGPGDPFPEGGSSWLGVAEAGETSKEEPGKPTIPPGKVESVEALIHQLKDSAWRSVTIQKLSHWRIEGDKKKIASALVAELPACHEDQVLRIAQTLANWQEKSCAVAIAEYAVNRKEPLREEALAAFRKSMAPEASPYLLKGLPMDALFSSSNNPLLYDAIRKAPQLIELAGASRNPASVKTFVSLLKSDHGKVVASASKALGDLGTEEAVAALEKKYKEVENGIGVQVYRKQDYMRGLMRAAHPRARKRLGAFMKQAKNNERMEAAEIFAETARPEDAELLIQWIEDPDPLLRQSLLPALPEISAGAKLPLERAWDRAMTRGRFQTALRIAESLGDNAREAAAKEKWDERFSSAMKESSLGKWLQTKRKADVLAEYPEAKDHLVGYLDSKVREGAIVYRYSSPGAYVLGIPDTLTFGALADDTVISVVVAGPKFNQPVFGVGVGAPIEQAWELYGDSPYGTAPVLRLSYQLDPLVPEDHAMNLWVNYGEDLKVNSVILTREVDRD